MGLPSCWSNSSVPLVLDASVAINLNATGNASRILGAIPNAIVIVDVVARELEAGRLKGRTDADMVAALVVSGRAQLESLSADCEGNFLAMVSGSGATTLDDGEAATIAWAVANGGIPVIDEKKGLAIGQDRFSLPMATTTDLLVHELVLAELGAVELAESVFNALTRARMRVQERHIPWVVKTIGQERAALCTSLPRSSRIARSHCFE